MQIVNIAKPNPINLRNYDSTFAGIYDEVKGNTAISHLRLSVLYQFAERSAAFSREPFAEVGVYRGGSAYMLACIARDREIHAYDTFEGMPETDVRDLHKKGDFQIAEHEVLAFLKKKQNIVVHKGFFPGTAVEQKSTNFSFVHIDVDIYQSVLDYLTFFYPRTVRGGVLLSDDYGMLSCPGAKLAWDEFFADKPEVSVYLPTGQSFVIKE